VRSAFALVPLAVTLAACAPDSAPPPDRGTPAAARSPSAPSTPFQAELYLRSFATTLELAGAAPIDSTLLAAAIAENDYEGSAFRAALAALNRNLGALGERPIARPLPEGLGSGGAPPSRPPETP